MGEGQPRIAQRFNSTLGWTVKGRENGRNTKMALLTKLPATAQTRHEASPVRGVIFPLSKTSRFFSNAFNAISRPRCPARKMWEGIIPAVSTRKNVGHVQLRSGKRVKTVRRSRVGHSVGYPTHSIAREGGLI